MATDLQNLQSIRSNLLQEVANETAYVAANGPKPTYSIDGQAVSWTEWLTARLAQIERLNDLLHKETFEALNVLELRIQGMT
jgi:hypothetical protein